MPASTIAVDARAGAADVAARLERAVQRARRAPARPPCRARALRRAPRRPARGNPARRPRRPATRRPRRPAGSDSSGRARARRGTARGPCSRRMTSRIGYHFSSNRPSTYSSAENGTRSSMPFADADVANRQLQIVRDGDRDAALRRAIELRQHDAVDAGDARELARLRAGRSVRPWHRARAALRAARPATSRAATRRILSSSFIRLTRVCRRPAVSTSTGRAPAPWPTRSRRTRPPPDRAPSRARTMSTPARARPDLELLDGRRAKRVGRADERLPPFVLQQVGQLADRRRLAGAVDADDQRDARRRRADGERPIDRREDRADLLLDEVAQALAVARPRLARRR